MAFGFAIIIRRQLALAVKSSESHRLRIGWRGFVSLKDLHDHSFFPYHDKLFVEFYRYDDELIEKIEKGSGNFTYGYVAIGDTLSDFKTFDITNK